MLLFLALFFPHADVLNHADECADDLGCSLNGQCTAVPGNQKVCICDAPWEGPACGVLGYNATTPKSGFSLYDNASDPRNTWNGAILREPSADGDGAYHLYVPAYPPGALGGTTTVLHGTARRVEGPYDWGVQNPDITLAAELGAFNGPKSVVYRDHHTNATKYSLWLGGAVYVADSAAGPFARLAGFTYPGNNPAPLYHDGAFYSTDSPCETVWTTPRLVAGAKWTAHGSIDHSVLPADWLAEDPAMWVDGRGHFHIVNHAYSAHEWRNCSGSVLSSHFFSADGGVTWHFLPQAVQPYSHTVRYDDGSAHMFVTMERPSMLFDERGRLTHIHLAADLVTGDEGCGERVNHTHFGHCPCDNCKYEDKGGTTIIALNV